MKTAFFVHIWYVDVYVKLIERHLILLKESGDFYFNLPESKNSPELRERLELLFPNCVILTSKNRGRDAGGYLNCLQYINKHNLYYDTYCFVHTKQVTDGGKWLNSMISSTLQYESFHQNIKILQEDLRVGMLGSPDYFFTGFYDANEKEKGEVLMKRLGINVDKIPFIAGTIFIIRACIADKYLRNNDFLEKAQEDLYEDGRISGTWGHAWERMFGAMTVAQNKLVAGIKNKTLLFHNNYTKN